MNAPQTFIPAPYICGCTVTTPCADHTPKAEAERHNAYGWIKPDADACHVCGKKAYATPVDGFQVRECTRCERLICEDHADTDCDSDQDGYFTTEWVCNTDRAECEAITMLNELADTVAYPFAVVVLTNAAEHLSERAELAA